MNKQKIKVSFSRVYDIEADKISEAQTKARAMAFDEIKELQEKYSDDTIAHSFIAEEYEPPVIWSKKAKESSQDIVDYLISDITIAVDNWKKENEISEISEDKEKATDAVFEEIYQEKDLYSMANEYADGKFIYNDNRSLGEALDAIRELEEEYEMDDDLWEKTGSTIEDQINAKATYTYANAIYQHLERSVKEKIKELL